MHFSLRQRELDKTPKPTICNLKLLGILHRAVKVPVDIAKSQDADQISSSKGIVALLCLALPL
jgi:hypothetical protein